MLRSDPHSSLRSSADTPSYSAWPPFGGAVFVVWSACFLAVNYERAGMLLEQQSRCIRAFGLTADTALAKLEIWRLVTYAALHGSFLNLAVNLCCLVLAPGMVVAKILGARRAIVYAMAGVLVGGVACAVGGLLAPTQTALGGTAMVASLIGVYTVVCGNDILFTIGRVAVPAWAVAMAMLLASLGSSVVGGQWINLLQGTGAIGGPLCFYLEPHVARWMIRHRIRNLERQRMRDADMRLRVDDLLDKIHAHGIQGLSWREKTFLRRTSRRMRQARRSRNGQIIP